jgi:phospholipase C
MNRRSNPSHSIRSHSRIAFLAAIAFLALIFPRPSRADGDLSKVKHVIIIMQENHSFDNYFGALELQRTEDRSALVEQAAAVWETANTRILVKMEREDIEAAWQKTRAALASFEVVETVGLDVAP